MTAYLKTALDAFRAEFLEKFPPEKAAIMQRATNALTPGGQWLSDLLQHPAAASFPPNPGRTTHTDSTIAH